MTADEWINEFSTQPHQQTKTVLHASNMLAPPEAPRAAPARKVGIAGGGVRYRSVGAMCLAGAVGFLLARRLTS